MTSLEEAIYAAEFVHAYNEQMKSRMSRVEFGDLAGYHRARERATHAAHNRASDIVAAHMYAPKTTP